jgi:hypothetical protein
MTRAGEEKCSMGASGLAGPALSAGCCFTAISGYTPLFTGSGGIPVALYGNGTN